MITRLLAGAALIAALAAPTGATAYDPAVEDLVAAIQNAGVTVYTGGTICKPGLAGAYLSSVSAMVLCVNGQQMAQWNEETVDTLRHESIHLIQDCFDGRRGDDRLVPTLDPEQTAKQLAETGINWKAIYATYSAKGTSDGDIYLELEAWSGAAYYSTSAITNAVNKFCS